jgi:2'-5' RNA ligase
LHGNSYISLSSNVFRAFIAITLSPEIQLGLAQTIDNLQNQLRRAPIRWVQPRNIHLTVKFLGNVSAANQGLLTRCLVAEASRHTAFELSIGGLGVFPTLNRPKVIWVGIEAPAELLMIHKGIEGEMARLGYAPEPRAFSPHLTLGRVSRNVRSDEYQLISSAINQSKVGFLGALRVSSLELIRSDLKPDGAIYTRLFSASLADKTVQ